jgi:hypothetical protein
MKVPRYKGRFWAIYDGAGKLVAVTVYKRGANEVRRRLLVSKPGEGYSSRDEADNDAPAAPFKNKPA